MCRQPSSLEFGAPGLQIRPVLKPQAPRSGGNSLAPHAGVSGRSFRVARPEDHPSPSLSHARSRLLPLPRARRAAWMLAAALAVMAALGFAASAGAHTGHTNNADTNIPHFHNVDSGDPHPGATTGTRRPGSPARRTTASSFGEERTAAVLDGHAERKEESRCLLAPKQPIAPVS